MYDTQDDCLDIVQLEANWYMTESSHDSVQGWGVSQNISCCPLDQNADPLRQTCSNMIRPCPPICWWSTRNVIRLVPRNFVATNFSFTNRKNLGLCEPPIPSNPS